MCGIAGFVSPSPIRSPSKILSQMLSALAHRGPDDEGRFLTKGRSYPKVALGNRRLAIIDLAGGKQPVFSERKDIVAVFNGEIYNYKELRRELESRGHNFASDSDTEVIPHLFEEHGVGFLEKLRGMFAIAICDGFSVVLARDRFGIKPLYYAELPGGGICFASEPQALASMVSLEPEPALLPTYLSLGYFPAPLTPYKHLKKLPAGTVLEYSKDKTILRRWWEPSSYFEPKLSNLREVGEALAEAVAAHTVADVPVGVLASGGLDSSVVAAFAARHSRQDVLAFTVGFQAPDGEERYSFDERSAAAAVCRHLGLDHITLETTLPRPEELWDLAHKYGEPIGDEAAIPTYAIAKEARRHVKVVLSGEGGDELFGGYDKYRAFHALRPLMAAPLPLQRAIGLVIPYLLGKQRASKIAAILSEDLVAASWHYDEIVTENERRRLLSPALRSWPRGTPELWPSLRERRRRGDFDPQWARATKDSFVERYFLSAQELASLMATDICGYLADGLLHKVDSSTMAHGLEARVPYLDHLLFEAVGGVGFLTERDTSLAYLTRAVRADSSKEVLREIAKDLLPPSVVLRKKHGFQVPLARWVSEFARSEIGRDLTAPERLSDQGFWNTEEVTKILDTCRMLGRPHTASTAEIRHVSKVGWSILAYQLWLETISQKS